MTRRTTNVVVSFMDRDVTPAPLATIYNVSTAGYRSPTGDHLYAPGRLKSNITIDKSIGSIFWQEGSAVEFGNVDIAIDDGGIDQIDGQLVDWVAWAKENTNPQVVISLVNDDRTLSHIATADARDVFFPNGRTIRISLEAKHGLDLDKFINTYYEGVNDNVNGQPRPIYWGAGGFNASVLPGFQLNSQFPTVLVDATTLRYDVTDLELAQPSDNPYAVLDRGVRLLEGSSGFVVVDSGFELQNNPDGKITLGWTANREGGVYDPLESGAMLQGPWRICRLILDRVGIDVATHYPSESTFSDLDLGVDGGQFPIVQYASEVSARSALDRIMDSVGGWWYVDELGDFQFGRLVAPENETPIASYTDADLVGDITAIVDRAPGLSTQVKTAQRPGFYEQDQLAGSVTPVYRDELSREWQNLSTTAEIPTMYSTAEGTEPMPIYASFVTTEIQDELDRRWTELYPGTRRFYEFTTPLRGFEALPDLGDTVTIQSDLFRLIETELAVFIRRIKMDLGKGLVTYQGWGGNPSSAEPGWLIGTDGTEYGYDSVTPPPGLPVTAGLYFDLDAASPGATPNQWDDQSGNGRHWTKTTGKDFPSISGGIAVFNGTSTSLTGPNMSGLTGGEMFVVMKKATAGSQSGFNTGAWKFGTAGQANHYLYQTDMYDDFGGSARYRAFTGGQFNNIVQNYHVLGIRNSFGALGYSASLNDLDNTPFTNPGGFRSIPLFGNDGTAYYLEADVKRIVVYDRVLTPSERTSVRDYLYNEYDIP